MNFWTLVLTIAHFISVYKALALSEAGNVIIRGTRKPGDTLLFEHRLIRRYKPFRVLTETVVYPSTPGQKAGFITMVDVHSSEHHSDDIQVKNGGVGQKFVKIRFMSARSRGLDYIIKVYGFPLKEMPNSVSVASDDKDAVEETNSSTVLVSSAEGGNM